MKRIASLIIGAVAVISAALYSGWWLAVAGGALYVVGTLVQTVLLHWVTQEGWRFWYGLGGATTYMLVLIRITPPLLSWLRDEGFPSLQAIAVGVLVFLAFPILATLFIAVGWPLVLYWLFADALRMVRRKSVGIAGPTESGDTTAVEM